MQFTQYDFIAWDKLTNAVRLESYSCRTPFASFYPFYLFRRALDVPTVEFLLTENEHVLPLTAALS